MAKRARKRPTSRATSARASERASRNDGQGVHDSRRPDAAQEADDRPGTGERILERVAQVLHQAVLLGRHHPLGRLYVTYMLQMLEWQSMFLEIYQRTLRDAPLDPSTDEHLRRMARSAMTAYLDLAKSAPERRERLLAGQTELARALSEAIENMRQHLATAAP